MGLSGHRRLSLTGSRGSQDESRPTSSHGEDETVVEPEQGNVLSHIISQLRPGADLSRVTLPTFILEPRSMLERITNFMAHPETLLPMPTIEDPVERFVSVVKFYLSGWHIKPPGVKKPLNPLLGETFTCYWEYPDNTKGYYISEQTSHHPPKSSYFFMIPEHNIRIDGTLKPRSKFLGNSAASLMEGIAVLRLMNRGTSKGGEKYFVTQPNMYARGILFGKMKYELGDHSFVRCPEQGLVADVEFKTKGYFGGTYNAIGGQIKNENTGEVLYELHGMWNGEMSIRNVVTGHKEILFDATDAKHSPPLVRPLEEQADRESQKLWHQTVVAINASDHNAATDEKTRIEEMQREEAAQRQQEGVEWYPRLFRAMHSGPGEPEEDEANLDWIIDTVIDGETAEEKTKQILDISPILPGQKAVEKPQVVRQAKPANPQAAAPQPPPQSGDLIDFGEPEPTQPTQPTQAQAPVPQQTSAPAPAPAQAQAPPASAAANSQSTASRPAATSSASHDLLGLDDAPAPAPAKAQHPSVRRLDTETNEIDEFVDARS